jgi:hypothetical protein
LKTEENKPQRSTAGKSFEMKVYLITNEMFYKKDTCSNISGNMQVYNKNTKE